MIGIYKITNLKNGKVYIGQSADIEERWKQHKKALMNSGKAWYPLAREESDNIDNFKFEIIQECKPQELDELEEYWIEEYKSNIEGYNTSIASTSGGYTIYKEKNFLLEKTLQKNIMKAMRELSSAGFNLLIYILTNPALIFSLSKKDYLKERNCARNTYMRGLQELQKFNYLVPMDKNNSYLILKFPDI